MNAYLVKATRHSKDGEVSSFEKMFTGYNDEKERDKVRLFNFVKKIKENTGEDFLINLIGENDTDILVFNFVEHNKVGIVLTNAEVKEVCKQLNSK